MPAAGDGDRAELLLGRAELEHVPAHDRGEVHGLREPAERHLEVLLERLRGVRLARPAVIDARWVAQATGNTLSTWRALPT